MLQHLPGRVAVLVPALAMLLMPPPAIHAQTDSNVVWAWGPTYAVTVANGAPSTPQLMESLHGATVASGANNYALFVQSDGTVWGWGGNNMGQLGDGTQTDRATPVQVSGLSDVIAVAAGGEGSSTALKRDGTVWDWGRHPMGDLQAVRTQLTPVQVSKLSGVTAIAHGPDFSLALESDGTVWIWHGGFGMLDVATQTALLQQHQLAGPVVPVQVTGLSGITAISAGGQFVLALRNDGVVLAWGTNNHGVLGSNPDRLERTTTPVQVEGLSSVTAIAAGMDHALALKSDGTVWAWGDDGFGQLGDGGLSGRSTAQPTPLAVRSLSGVTAIAAGSGFSLALKNDHTAWAWGYNGLGALGDASLSRHTYELSPVPVPGLPNSVVSIWAGSAGSQGFAVSGPLPGQPAATAPAPAVLPQEAPPPSGVTTDLPPASTPPTPADAPVPAMSEVPDTLTDAVRSDILAAVDRSNAAWAYATATLDTSTLGESVAGPLLESDLAEVDRLHSQGYTMTYITTAFAVVSVALDAPGHAVVQTSETWSADIHAATGGQLVDHLPTRRYAETYTIEYLNDAWIATEDVLQ